MTALIGALRVSLSAETAQFEQGMRRSQRTAQTTAQSIKKSFAGVGRAIAGGLTAGLSVGLLAGFAKQALDYASAIGEVSQQLGVTTKDLQVFRFAATQAGISQEEMEKALQRLTRSMGEAQVGSKRMIAAFGAIGISVDDLRGKDAGQVLRMMADGLAKVESSSQRAAVEAAILGRNGQQLDTLLSGGSKAINQLALAAEELGVVLSDEQIQRADDTADKLEAVKTVLAAQIAGVVADNAESILSLANALAQLAGAIAKFLGTNPRLAFALLGAALGGRFGIPGAIGGAVGGAILGGRVAKGAADGNTDLQFRMKQVRSAKQAFAAAQRGTPGPKGEFFRDPARIEAAEKELRRQTALLVNATTAFRARDSGGGGGGVALPQFLATGGGGGAKKGRTVDPERERLRALREAHQFDQELRRAQMDVLRATQDMATDAVERYAIGIQILDLEKRAFEAELQYETELHKLTDGKQGLSEVQAQQLRVEFEKLDALQRQKAIEEESARAREDSARLDGLSFDLAQEKMRTELDLARTAQEQRAIQLRMLDHAYRYEKARLETIMAEEKIGSLKWEEARRQLATLNATQGNRQAAVMRGTMGPMEQFFSQVPRTAAETAEWLERMKVQGIEGAIDSILALTEGFESFRDTAISAIKSVIAELIRMQLMKLALNLIGGAAGAPSAGSAAGASPFSNPVMGFAGGGFGVFGGLGGVDKNVLALNGVPIARVSRGEPFEIGHHLRDSAARGMTVHAPITIQGSASRETAMQIASAVRRTIADAAKRGY